MPTTCVRETPWGDDKILRLQVRLHHLQSPFGIEWKTSKKAVEEEHNLGEAGRFAPGLPAIGDGQMLFLLNGIAKLKDEEGRMAIIQNGSSLFKGDAGSGESEIRGYLLENDWLEAIVQLPQTTCSTTPVIATYIWIITKNKSEEREGKVQLIDASQCFDKRRKSLGNKRVEISDRCRELIMEAYRDFTDWSYQSEDETLKVESKVLDNDYFKYSKLTVERPLVDEETGEPILKKEKCSRMPRNVTPRLFPGQRISKPICRRMSSPTLPMLGLTRRKPRLAMRFPSRVSSTSMWLRAKAKRFLHI